jgi:hypothetical protein
MILGRWRTTKMIKELRKTRKQLSLRYRAMTKEELYQNEQRIFEWWSQMTGKPVGATGDSRK